MTSHLIPNFSSSISHIILGLFILAYVLVIAEEFIGLRKSKPVILAAGLMWAIIGYYAQAHNLSPYIEQQFTHFLLDYAEILLFLLVAITYIHTLEDRNVFAYLQGRLIRANLSMRQLFWLTGVLSFFISAVADNLTTALFMGAVVTAIAHTRPRFVALACINIVVAANAGGAFSPFGDLTTLMVWQKGILPFATFFHLFLPACVNFLIPAGLMSLAVPQGKLPSVSYQATNLKKGAYGVLVCFIATLLTTVLFQQYLHLSAALGMMTGLAYLQFYTYYTQRRQTSVIPLFPLMAKVEWDTLLFFYGIMMCVGALATVGLLTQMSHFLYGPTLAQFIGLDQPHTLAHILIGLISAVIDNIPMMFGILNMNPEMSTGQWLLITLTTGVGGSILSIGSAAGVALMGQAPGTYTFGRHLKWSPVILLGYLAAILVHLLWNQRLF